MLMGCNGVNGALHKSDKHKAHHTAKLQKKAAKLEYQAAELLNQAKELRDRANPTGGNTPRAQTKNSTRNTVDSVKGSGDTYLHATDVRYNCSTAGDGHFLDVTIGGNCSTAGDAHFNDVTIDGNCSTAGDASLKNVAIHGSLKTAGDATLDTVVADSAIHSGSVTMHNCEVRQNATMSGRAILVDTKIASDMKLSGELKQFENCSCNALQLCPGNDSTTILKSSTVSTITVKHGTNWSFFGININIGNNCKKATIELDGTVVTGDIIFDDLAGRVIIRNGGQIAGQVIGGDIIYTVEK